MLMMMIASNYNIHLAEIELLFQTGNALCVYYDIIFFLLVERNLSRILDVVQHPATMRSFFLKLI
jgi:hypothetical protein